MQWPKIFIWIVVELLLNFTGLDDLADYSEFIFNQNPVMEVESYSHNHTGFRLQGDEKLPTLPHFLPSQNFI